MAGSLTALSLVQGGPPPSFLGDVMVQYLCGEQRYMQANIAHVPNPEVQEELRMVHCITTLLLWVWTQTCTVSSINW